MDLENFLSQRSNWLNSDNRNCLYSGIKVIRNLKNKLFPRKNKNAFAGINKLIDSALAENKIPFLKIKISSLSDHEIRLLKEKKLIPGLKRAEAKHVNLYVLYKMDSFLLTNYQDHLTIYSLESGSDFPNSLKNTQKILRFFSEDIFAKDQYGNFLTSKLEAYGSGTKIAQTYILPYSRYFNKLTELTKNLAQNGYKYTGLFGYEDLSEDLLVVANQESFTTNLEEAISKFKDLNLKIRDYEESFRIKFEENREAYEEKIINSLVCEMKEEELSFEKFLKIYFNISLLEKYQDLFKFPWNLWLDFLQENHIFLAYNESFSDITSGKLRLRLLDPVLDKLLKYYEVRKC